MTASYDESYVAQQVRLAKTLADQGHDRGARDAMARALSAILPHQWPTPDHVAEAGYDDIHLLTLLSALGFDDPSSH